MDLQQKDNGGQFKIVGIITSPDFQKCRLYTERLHKVYPYLYPKPDVKALLNVEWEEYIIQARRSFGRRLWAIQKPVTVFLNNNYLGDDEDLMEYICNRFQIGLELDFYDVGKKELLKVLEEASEKGRKFAYITVTIDKRVIGTMLFELYSDLVPVTCTRFIHMCKATRNGFNHTPIHRIVRGGWIQCGGWNLKHHRMPCENYIVPHDARGILFMCHAGKHQENSYQFGISLAPQPWMNYKYVAFGKLLQGTEILRKIESVPTYYEAPQKEIIIMSAGEYSLYPTTDKHTIEYLNRYLERLDTDATGMHRDACDPRDVPSVLDIRGYRKGLYSLKTDERSYVPFLLLPDYLLSYLSASIRDEPEEDEEEITSLYLPLHSSNINTDDIKQKLTLIEDIEEELPQSVNEADGNNVQSETSSTQIVKDILRETLSTVFEEPELEQ